MTNVSTQTDEEKTNYAIMKFYRTKKFDSFIKIISYMLICVPNRVLIEKNMLDDLMQFLLSIDIKSHIYSTVSKLKKNICYY